VQRQPGSNQTSGEHQGIDNVLGLYGKLFELSGGTFSVELTSVKTQGDKVVAVHHVKGEREGKTLDADETTTIGECRSARYGPTLRTQSPIMLA